MQGGGGGDEEVNIDELASNLSIYKDQLHQVRQLLIDEPSNSEYVDMERELCELYVHGGEIAIAFLRGGVHIFYGPNFAPVYNYQITVGSAIAVPAFSSTSCCSASVWHDTSKNYTILKIIRVLPPPVPISQVKANSSTWEHSIAERFWWSLLVGVDWWDAVGCTQSAAEDGIEIAKSFDFAAEERIYNWWESQGYFMPNFDRGDDPFVISMPPPNVTGSLHMGHAMFVTHEDIMVRYNRMKGRPTLWLPGTDHAGIATQLVVERMLASEGIKRVEISRDEFTRRVWQWKEKYGGTITNQIKRLGASCDWSREHFTLDEQLSQAVVEAFVRLHEKGLIYQGSYMVNWSPTLQTAVSDLEVEYSEESGYLYHIRYRVAGGSRDDWLTVATTRPETLFGDVALAVNPQDDRYSKYIGQMAIVPLTFGLHVPIIADKHVDIEFGTGVLKISPGHDHNDYLLARKLGLPILNVMNKDGTLNEVGGMYSLEL
ncbi:valine--tRNA ligase [Trifolium repens]|nr:valine--tRNA ligase [Trifolium repens]